MATATQGKIRGLWIGDAVASTGFATVCHNVIKNLPTRSLEIHHLGVNYYGDPHPYKHAIYPAALGGDIYGIRRLEPLIKGIKPHFLFILNDPWIIDMYLQELKDKNITDIPIIVYFPVDAREHSYKWFRNYDMVSELCVYTDFARNVITKANAVNVREKKIHVIPHGCDLSTFFPLPSEESRASIYPKVRLPEFLRSFVVFNGNRNQPRKRIDITIWAFREFQKNKPDAKLYCHMGTQDSGVDIIELSIRYGFSNKLVISANTPSIPNVPIDRLNKIYNAVDIGINTSMGEGWGLVNWEHAATGKPQVMPDMEYSREIWGDTAFLVPTERDQMFPNINTVGSVVNQDKLVEMLEFLYEDWKTGGHLMKEKADAAYQRVSQEKYTWKSVASQFNDIIKNVI